MDPGHGGLAQDDLHPADVGPHLLRQLEGAGIGIGPGIGPHPRHPVAEGNTRLFQGNGHNLNKFVPGKFHVARQLRLHLLPVDVQPQIVVYLADDLLKGILPQAGVDAGPDGEDEVPQALRGKPGPQVDGNGQGHRQLLLGALPVLLVHQHLQQHRRQIFRNGCPVLLGLLLQLPHRAEAHGHVEGIEGLRRTGVGIGLLQRGKASGLYGSVPGVGVLQFLRPGGLIHVQHPAGIGNLVAQLPEIDRQQSTQQGHGAPAVADGVKHLQGDPPLIVEKTHQPPIPLVKAHGLAGIGDILLHKGTGGVVELRIIPEDPRLDTHPKAGKAGHGLVHRPLEGLRVHRLIHHGREAIYRRVGLLLDGGVDHSRIVQPVPLFMLSLLSAGSICRHDAPPFAEKRIPHSVVAHK